ncbi:MAG: RNA 2',3'-cyclic phosphodiesterase [Candidatus Aureabacteria bacterium]|nr:RNA 2',3'-cyclic phosphodiesterase [Candidatus Auribacterota bacterium]
MNKVRSFLAVDMPQEAKAAISRFIKPLKSGFPDIRWVKSENIHITLMFFGYLEQRDIEVLTGAIGESLSNFGSFTFSLQGLGFFGKGEYPKVIWLGVGEGREKMSGLNRIIKDAAEKRGIALKEEDFFPHLTVGRCKKRAGGFSAAIDGLDKTPIAFVDCKMLSFCSSELTAEGPIYRKLAEIKI